MTPHALYVVGDVFDTLAAIPDRSVDLVLTSPPFLALRKYLPDDHPGKQYELGREPHPAAFLDNLLRLTVEWRRILTPHGSIAVELGDTYSGSGGGGGDYLPGGMRAGQPGFAGSAAAARDAVGVRAGNAAHWRAKAAHRDKWPLPKSLTGIPTLYAWSLAYGRNLLNPDHVLEPWRIRNLVAWVRPNPPVGALGDKFRPATSYLTVATVAGDRWFDLDAVREPSKTGDRVMYQSGKADRATGGSALVSHEGFQQNNPAGAPPLDWWRIPTQPYKGSHYATWPEKLLDRPILSMCPQRVCTTCGQPSRRIVDAKRIGEGREVNVLRPYPGNDELPQVWAPACYPTKAQAVDALGVMAGRFLDLRAAVQSYVIARTEGEDSSVLGYCYGQMHDAARGVL